MSICKITTPAARNNYLAADLGVVLHNKHTLSPLARLYCAEQSGRAAANDDRVVDHAER